MASPSVSLTRLTARLNDLWTSEQDRGVLRGALRALDERYRLGDKIDREPAVADVVVQMFERLAAAYQPLGRLEGKRVLDIACGSNSSKAPANIHMPTPFGRFTFRRARKGYAARFEPWMCRILLELGADPVGVDFGDLEGERFEHHHVDLGQIDALDFLPGMSFDGIQDSRLFGSPEFAALFPREADRLRIAREIREQEQRLLKPEGVIIHSDAAERLG
jgi:hypothetical protein